MKTLKLIIGLVMLATAGTSLAESKVTTVVDGQTIPKDLTKLTFNDKMVTLTFSDNSTETVGMELVSIALDHSGNTTSGIEDVIANPEKKTGVYNIKGQYLGENAENMQPGVYIINGQKVYVK